MFYCLCVFKVKNITISLADVPYESSVMTLGNIIFHSTGSRGISITSSKEISATNVYLLHIVT